MRLPDVETLVIAFLNARLAPIQAHSKVPASRPATFVRAWRTGGAALNRVIDQPIISVQAWAPDGVSASDLAQDCREHLFNEYTLMPLVRSVEEVSGLYYDPDPTAGIDRYTFSVQLSVRAAR